MKTISKGFAGLMTIGLALSAVGCSGSPGATGQGSETKTSLTVGVSAVPQTLDPGQNFTTEQANILTVASGTLTTMNKAGNEVSMLLAESVEPEDNKYVVKLKPDLKFSDGSALTAKDVAASFTYYMADATNGFSYVYAPIEKVTAVDDLTVDFDLKQKTYASLPFALSLDMFAIIPAKVIEAKGKDLYKGDPLPSGGPFMITSSTQNDITLEANPYYTGKRPSTKKLLFKKLLDANTRLAQVQSGQLDVAIGLPPQQVKQLSAPVEPRSSTTTVGLSALLMNNRKNSVLQDVRIRQAIAQALDRNQINEIAYAGLSKPALGLYNSGSQFAHEFLSAGADVAKAKQLLTGTACESGCALRFPTDSSDEAAGSAASVIQQNLKAIGIDARIEKAEKTVVTQRQTDGDYDISLSGVVSFDGWPDDYVGYALGESTKALRTGYANPEMFRLVAAVATTGGDERAQNIAQINALFEKEMPMAPVLTRVFVAAARVPEDTFSIDPTSLYHVG